MKIISKRSNMRNLILVGAMVSAKFALYVVVAKSNIIQIIMDKNDYILLN